MWVLISHAWLTVWPIYFLDKHPVGAMATATGWMLYGRFAVDIFIVVSGFCLMLPVMSAGGMLRGGMMEFYRRRAWRILPPYYAALGLSVLLCWLFIGEKTGTHWDISLPADGPAILAHLFMIQNVIYTYKVNHALWSIAVEWQIYFLLPPMIWFARRIGILPVVLLSIFAGYFASWGARATRFDSATFYYLGLFALGVYAAHLSATPRSLPRWTLLGVSLPLTVLIMIVCANLTLHEYILYTPWLDLAAGLAVVPILVAGVRYPNAVISRVLSAKPLVVIGAFSYSLYLIHAPLLQLVWQYAIAPLGLGPNLSFLLLIGFGCPVIVSAAFVFYRMVEKPCLGRRPVAAPTGCVAAT